jgi:hypothetical protein
MMFFLQVGAQESMPALEKDTTLFDAEKKEFTYITKKIVIGEDESGNTLTAYFLKKRTGETNYKYTHFICLYSEMDLGCSGTGDNYIKIKLENGETIKLDKDISTINCVPPAESTYLLDDEIYEKLKVNEPVSMRFKQSKNWADFTIRYPDLFKNMAFFLRKIL